MRYDGKPPPSLALLASQSLRRIAYWHTSLPPLLVSQFTLLAKTKKGTKPDFHGAANPEEASRLYQYFVQKVRGQYEEERVKDGVFQAMMEVALVNDGPVCLDVSLCLLCS
jgi:D-tyrosyl-tRNA(Tyr) deacylase